MAYRRANRFYKRRSEKWSWDKENSGYIKINSLPGDDIHASFGTLFSFQDYSKDEFNIEAVEYSSYNSNELNEYVDIPTNIIEQKNRISFDIDQLIIDDRYFYTKLEKYLPM
ncbi:MAG: hypothetical protein ABIP95_08205 [Pelobium sp.]